MCFLGIISGSFEQISLIVQKLLLLILNMFLPEYPEETIPVVLENSSTHSVSMFPFIVMFFSILQY